MKWWLWSTDGDKEPCVFSVLNAGRAFRESLPVVLWGVVPHGTLPTLHLSFKCWSPFLPVQPTSTCLLCTLLGLTSCPSGLKNRRRRLFSSKSVQQRGFDRVTRGLLVLQAGNKPCCPCPGLLSSPWAYIRHTAVPCGYCLGTSTGAAVSAGQTRVADRGGSVHVLQLWLSCAALGAQTDHSLAASSANAELSLFPGNFGVP